MNRPYLVNFSSIINDRQLNIRISLTMSVTQQYGKANPSEKPIDSISLFSKEIFRVRIIGLNSNNVQILSREYDSDNYGNFQLKLSAFVGDQRIERLSIFETLTIPGVEFHLGGFLPLVIKMPKKILITDFDKTLVDTKYHTPREMYHSLNRPLNFFPTVESSVDKIKDYIAKDFQPFVLSASPHFYENAIRDWLYQHEIFASNIFLKDYRDFISIFEGRLSTKDLKIHGFYKLNKLIDILLMTGIPDELVLFGDGFESDPFIYLTLQELLDKKTDPWKLWKSLKNHSFFNLTNKQDSIFITKFYQLNEMAKNKDTMYLKIFIRAVEDNLTELQEYKFDKKTLSDYNTSVNYYLG